MLKNENAIEFAKRICKKDDGTDQSFLEEEEFDEILRTMLKTSVQGWSGFVSRLKELGYSEFKIGYCFGELKSRLDRKEIWNE